MAALAGPVAGGNAHRTYQGLMGDPAYDPSLTGTEGTAGEGNPTPGYVAVFNRWRVTGDTAPTSEQVHRDLLTDFDATVGAVGYFVTNGGTPTGTLKITHGFRTFVGLPTTTTNRGKTFGYVGNVVGGTDVNTFKLDPNQLGRTSETRCARTPERHLELLLAEPGVEAIGPIEEDAPSTAMTRTRGAMFIPYGLVEYVIDRELTARQAFETLWPIILAKGWREHTKPLVNFLIVATTLHSEFLPTRTLNAILGHGPTSAAEVLSERREKVLFHQLPALWPTAPVGPGAGAVPGGTSGTLDPFMVALLAQVAQMNDQARIDRDDRVEYREQAARPKSVRERFQAYTTDKLVALTNTPGDDDDLPRLYHELAGRQKGISKRMILQQAYDLTADELKLNRLLASPSHVLDLDQWDYIGTGMDAVGTGLLPFSIVPPDAPSKQAKKDQSRQYDLSGEGVAGAISATDAKRLYNPKGYVACEWSEADVQLELYGVMLGALLGTLHMVTRHHLLAYRYYTRIRTRLQAAMNRGYGPALAPPLLVLHFQLIYRSWFEEQFVFQMNDNPDPDVTSGLQSFMRSNRLDWVPGYESIPCLAALAVAPAQPPAPAGGGSTAPPRTVGGGGGGGTRTAVPTSPPSSGPPTPASQAAPPLVVPPAVVERVQNAHRDSRLTGNSPLANSVYRRTIHTAIETAGTGPPTVTRAGTSMPTCLSWHVKGTCLAQCHRRADHVINTAEEKEALWEWVKLAFA